jgi:hypothetical protein
MTRGQKAVWARHNFNCSKLRDSSFISPWMTEEIWNADLWTCVLRRIVGEARIQLNWLSLDPTCSLRHLTWCALHIAQNSFQIRAENDGMPLHDAKNWLHIQRGGIPSEKIICVHDLECDLLDSILNKFDNSYWHAMWRAAVLSHSKRAARSFLVFGAVKAASQAEVCDLQETGSHFQELGNENRSGTKDFVWRRSMLKFICSRCVFVHPNARTVCSCKRARNLLECPACFTVPLNELLSWRPVSTVTLPNGHSSAIFLIRQNWWSADSVPAAWLWKALPVRHSTQENTLNFFNSLL